LELAGVNPVSRASLWPRRWVEETKGDLWHCPVWEASGRRIRAAVGLGAQATRRHGLGA